MLDDGGVDGGVLPPSANNAGVLGVGVVRVGDVLGAEVVGVGGVFGAGVARVGVFGVGVVGVGGVLGAGGVEVVGVPGGVSSRAGRLTSSPSLADSRSNRRTGMGSLPSGEFNLPDSSSFCTATACCRMVGLAIRRPTAAIGQPSWRIFTIKFIICKEVPPYSPNGRITESSTSGKLITDDHSLRIEISKLPSGATSGASSVIV